MFDDFDRFESCNAAHCLVQRQELLHSGKAGTDKGQSLLPVIFLTAQLVASNAISVKDFGNESLFSTKYRTPLPLLEKLTDELALRCRHGHQIAGRPDVSQRMIVGWSLMFFLFEPLTGISPGHESEESVHYGHCVNREESGDKVNDFYVRSY